MKKINLIFACLIIIALTNFSAFSQIAINDLTYERGYQGGFEDSKDLIDMVFQLDPQTGVRCGSGPATGFGDDDNSGGLNCQYYLDKAIIDVFADPNVIFRINLLSGLADDGSEYHAGARDGLVAGLREASHYPEQD